MTISETLSANKKITKRCKNSFIQVKVHCFGGQEHSAEDVAAINAYAHSLGIHPVKLIALMEAAGGTQFWDAAYKAQNQSDDSRGQEGNQSDDQSIAS